MRGVCSLYVPHYAFFQFRVNGKVLSKERLRQ